MQAYSKALEIHQKVNGEDHVDTAGTYNNLGVVVKHSGTLE